MTQFVQRLKTIKFDRQTRIRMAIVFFILAIFVTAAGVVLIRIEVSEAEEFEKIFKDEVDRFNDPRSIFGNNMIHTLIMFVPVIGLFWGFLILFNTGTIISIISTAHGIPPILTFISLFLIPIFWLEFCAYSLAMAQSVTWFVQILRGQGRREAMRTCILVTICAAILLLAAIVEWFMIN